MVTKTSARRERRFHLPRPALVAADMGAWSLGVVLAMAVRFDLQMVMWTVWRPEVFIVVGAVATGVAGVTAGLYQGRFRRGSLDEGCALGLVVALATTVAFVVNQVGVGGQLVPASVALAAGPVALCGAGSVRFVERYVGMRASRRRREGAVPVLIFGAGDGGVQVVNSMHDDAKGRFAPLGFVDDDPAKRHLRLRGVPVLGGRDQLPAMISETGAEMLVVAAPSITSAVLRDLSARALAADIALRMVPSVAELIDGNVSADDVRPLTEADLLGRHQIDTDIEAIADYVTGRRVLVTGAGGSIGSELCHQLHRFGPAELVMLDRDESALHTVQMAIEGRALLDSECLVVADIRDRNRMREVFDRHRPHVVFHTAALKHLPLLEMHPAEAVKTNVFGTLHVLEAAAGAGVERFVNISTDKAADPSSILGYTKRIAEQLTSWFAQREGGTFLSVRFGNVLGSRGSVLGAFERQIRDGGPLTVTHPDVTRYFMTVQEAVQLVIQAGAVGGPGEALVLDMGEPVRIVDVARRLVAQSDRPIDIVFTGLRSGEKLHEVLLGQCEIDERPAHPLISHCQVPPLPPVDLEPLGTDDPARLRSLVADLGRVAPSAQPIRL